MKGDKIVEIPIEELSTPKNHYRCIMDNFWVVRNNKALVLINGYKA